MQPEAVRQEVEVAATPVVEGVSTQVEQSASRHDAHTHDAREQEAKAYIYHKESTTRTNAINKESGACGLGQAYPCSKLPCSLSDYACQDKWFTNYAVSRYGSWVKAKEFWVAHKYW